MSARAPNLPPEVFQVEERPERSFEGRRRIWIIIILVLLFLFVAFVMQKCATPTSGAENLLRTGNPPTKSGNPTPTAIVGALPQLISTPLPSQPTAIPIKPGGSVVCRANGDVLGSSFILPANSLVRVTGYSQARGGIVQIEGKWFNAADFRCEQDYTVLEVPYKIDATATRERSSALAIPQPPLPIPSLSIPFPTSTPIPSPTATPLNGIWRDGDCWQVQVNGVEAIYVNGRGTSTGRYCVVNEIRIVINKAAP